MWEWDIKMPNHKQSSGRGVIDLAVVRRVWAQWEYLRLMWNRCCCWKDRFLLWANVFILKDGKINWEEFNVLYFEETITQHPFSLENKALLSFFFSRRIESRIHIAWLFEPTMAYKFGKANIIEWKNFILNAWYSNVKHFITVPNVHSHTLFLSMHGNIIFTIE